MLKRRASARIAQRLDQAVDLFGVDDARLAIARFEEEPPAFDKPELKLLLPDNEFTVLLVNYKQIPFPKAKARSQRSWNDNASAFVDRNPLAHGALA
ncbi:MAG: hypothetical protein ABL957_13810 [Parvularculaceae bacterium]